MDDFNRAYEKYSKSSALEAFLFLSSVVIMIFGILNIGKGAFETMKYIFLASLSYELSLYKGIDLDKRRSLWEHIKSALLKNVMLLSFLMLVWLYNVVFGDKELAFGYGVASFFYAQVVYSFSKDEDCLVTFVSLIIVQIAMLSMCGGPAIGGALFPFMYIFL